MKHFTGNAFDRAKEIKEFMLPDHVASYTGTRKVTRIKATLISGVVNILLVFLYSCNPDIEPEKIPGRNRVPQNTCAANVDSGYTDKNSYSPGEKVTVFLQATKAKSFCRLNIYDVNGILAFAVTSPLFVQQISQNEPYSNGFNFNPTVEIPIPMDAKSGIYLIENKIPFIIKSNEPIDLLIVYPSNTANAYELSGGKNLYTSPPNQRPAAVSFHRPIGLQSFSINCLQWFRSIANIKIGYIADIDLDDYQNISQARILCIVGHSEYWTRRARLNFDAFVDSGGHALILSGNTMWWQVRYSDDLNTLICYKDASLDPETNPLLKTIVWAEASLNYSIIGSIGADFNHGGYGLNTDQGWNGLKIVSPLSPLLAGLNLSKGDVLSCPSHEYDGAPILSFDADGFPVLDEAQMNVKKVELIAFDKGRRANETYNTFIVMQRAKDSGVIINTGTTDWCSENGMGGSSGYALKKITLNAITNLLNNQTVFLE